MFTIIEKDGRVPCDDPKLEAYKQMAYLARCGTGYSLRVENDEFTVTGDGSVMALTFYRRIR
jgi:hypothetical protein